MDKIILIQDLRDELIKPFGRSSNSGLDYYLETTDKSSFVVSEKLDIRKMNDQKLDDWKRCVFLEHSIDLAIWNGKYKIEKMVLCRNTAEIRILCSTVGLTVVEVNKIKYKIKPNVGYSPLIFTFKRDKQTFDTWSLESPICSLLQL